MTEVEVRTRQLRPSLWDDIEFQRLPPLVRLAYFQLVSWADDHGRIALDVGRVGTALLPQDQANKEDILNLLIVNNRLHLYEVNGCRYGWLCRWEAEQRPVNPSPSRLPPPLAIGCVPLERRWDDPPDYAVSAAAAASQEEATMACLVHWNAEGTASTPSWFGLSRQAVGRQLTEALLYLRERGQGPELLQRAISFVARTKYRTYVRNDGVKIDRLMRPDLLLGKRGAGKEEVAIAIDSLLQAMGDWQPPTVKADNKAVLRGKTDRYLTSRKPEGWLEELRRRHPDLGDRQTWLPCILREAMAAGGELGAAAREERRRREQDPSEL